MFALISRILNLSGRYKSRIQAAFLCAFVESILSKMPIFMAFIVLAGFADNTLTGKTCLFVGLGLLAVVVVQTVVHYLSDRLQSAAGFMIFADTTTCINRPCAGRRPIGWWGSTPPGFSPSSTTRP